MEEYAIENNHQIDLEKLKAEQMLPEDYIKTHKDKVISCHDVIIQYEGGALLVTRINYPAKNILWPVGGAINRGMKTKESLMKKVWEECKLNLFDVKYLDIARTFFETDPFEHGRGTDSINLMYFARGKGNLKLDNLHETPKIILPKQYTETFRKTLHPYVQNFLDMSIPLIK